MHFSLIKPITKIQYSSQSLSSKIFCMCWNTIVVIFESYSNEVFQKVISNHEPPLREQFGERGKRSPSSRIVPPAAISRLRWSLEIEFRGRTRGFLIRIWGFSRNILPYIRQNGRIRSNGGIYSTLLGKGRQVLGVVGRRRGRERSGSENERSRPQTPSENAKLWRLTGGETDEDLRHLLVLVYRVSRL